MTAGDSAVREFLAAYGRTGDPHVGPRTRQPTAEQRAALAKQLQAIHARNAAFLWATAAVILAIAVASLALAVAVGGDDRLGYLSGVAAVLCIPIGNHLRSLWRDKCRVEALLAVLPLLPVDQWLDALERFLHRDTDLTTAANAHRSEAASDQRTEGGG